MQSGPGQTSLFVNPLEFEKAAIYTHQNYLSTPFTAKNKLKYRAICLLENGQIRDVSTTLGCMKDDGSVDLNAVSQYYQSPVKKVIYRPNHELLHSLRQAAMVGKIKEYYDRNMPGKCTDMQPKHLERLQLMMLFSVAGRHDETGFHDSQQAKEEYYLKYRAESAMAFLECAKQYPGLYDLNNPAEKMQLYHDALMVELMGNVNIPTDIETGNYSIVRLIKNENLPLPDRNETFPSIYLNFMNTAHALDLLRVYPPDENNGAKAVCKIHSLEATMANY